MTTSVAFGSRRCDARRISAATPAQPGSYLEVSASQTPFNTGTCGILDSGLPDCWGNNVFGLGATRTCAITSAELFVCWGGHSSNGAPVGPTPTGTFTAVSTGHDHACAIRTNGFVECTGDDDFGEGSPPPLRFGAISAGSFHTCGGSIRIHFAPSGEGVREATLVLDTNAVPAS